jgi:hypothetical protein
VGAFDVIPVSEHRSHEARLWCPGADSRWTKCMRRDSVQWRGYLTRHRST